MMRLLATLALAAAAIAGGCSSADSGKPSADSGGEATAPRRLRIAVIPKGTTHDFWKSVHYGALKAAEELGVEIIWKGTLDETDKQGQIKLVQNFALEGVDGICLAPIDHAALVPAVKFARGQNIPVVVFDSGLNGPENYVSYVATNNRHGGEIAARYLGKLLGGKGNVILLRYQAGSESTEQREAGFLDTLRKEFPEIRILSENQRANSDALEAKKRATALLQQFGDQVDGVFTVCEPNNRGMLAALESLQMAGKVKFVGFDSDPRFVDALREGKMHGIVLQDPVRMGYLAVKTMVQHLRGEQVPKRISTGEYLATPENMDTPEIKRLLFPEKVE